MLREIRARWYRPRRLNVAVFLQGETGSYAQRMAMGRLAEDHGGE